MLLAGALLKDSAQGYRTQITRFPNDGLGIAVLVNEDRGVYAYEAIKWRIAEELLGLPHRVDWNQRYVLLVL